MERSIEMMPPGIEKQVLLVRYAAASFRCPNLKLTNGSF
jgi:hypothetical protein